MHAGLDLNIQTDPFKSSSKTQNMLPPYGNGDAEEEKPLHFGMPSSSVHDQQLPAQIPLFDPSDMMMQPTFPAMEGLGLWDPTTVQESVMNINSTQTHEGSFIMGEGSGSGSVLDQFQFNGVANYVEPMTPSTLGIGGRGMGSYPPYLFQAMMSADGIYGNANIYNPAAAIQKAKAANRRLRRMIKNRESAGRQRARRQAYDAQLEYENRKLRKENESLRKMIKDLSNFVASDKVKNGEGRSFSGPF